jgi:hypothetical protein
VFIKAAYLSVENSQLIADTIAHLINTGSEDYFDLAAAKKDNSAFIELRVRPLDMSENPLSENADRSEAIQCVTSKGARITILLPNPKDRQLYPAVIIIPEEGLG